MGLMIKFFCFVLVLGLAGLFVLKKPDGQPWLSADDFIPDTRSITNSVKEAIPDQLIGGSESSGDKVAVYKWKDAEGNWQFSDKAPAGISAEQVLVGTDVNRDLAPLPPPQRTNTQQQASSGKAILIKDSGILSPTTIAPDKIETLINDAKNVQNLADERVKQLDAAGQ